MSVHFRNFILFDFFSVILTGLPVPPALLSVWKQKDNNYKQSNTQYI